MKTPTKNLDSLVQPIGGLMNHVMRLTPHPGDPDFPIYASSLGKLGNLRPDVFSAAMEDDVMSGAGGDVAPEFARTKAIAEGLERYASCVTDARQFLWATANELGAEALDLDTVPRCSEAELAHSRCLLRPADMNAPIRWVRGISLFDGRPVWIPAVMVYLKTGAMSVGERFVLPISTGCGAHVTAEQALLAGVNEVIERDAISLVWLQQLALPRIELDVVPAWVQPFIEREARSRNSMETLLFDATTDVGVPTIYSLHIAPHNETLATLVMCSTELDPAISVAKVMRESASSRTTLQQERELPTSWDDYISVSHGAAFMGRRAQLPAFDFLRSSPHRRKLSEMPVLATGDPRRDLACVIEQLRQRGMEAFAVDLTTDEARRVGMWVVRVIVPALQPLSFSYRARYLGHPRLYEAPRLMGYPVRAEADINPWPQPFA